MRTTVTVRHCEIPAALRTRAEAVTRRLGALTSRAREAEVVFDLDGLACTAELRVQLDGTPALVAAGTGPNHRSALDEAEDRMRRQLERTATTARARTRRAEGAGQA